MKNKNKLTRLSAEGANLDLPYYNGAFERFQADLKQLLYDNFGYALSQTLEYDNDCLEFFVTLTETHSVDAGGGYPKVFQDLRTRVSIDPRIPLLPQFQYIATCRAKLLEMSTDIVIRYELARKTQL